MNIRANKLENITWFTDPKTQTKNEPGVYHSFMAGLATAINYMENGLDPTWLMGSSAFAFRIFVNIGLCPSAMSMFSFYDLLPEAVEQAGYKCIYVQRMYDEEKSSLDTIKSLAAGKVCRGRRYQFY